MAVNCRRNLERFELFEDLTFTEKFDDDVDGDICYLVTPLLRNMDDPSFETVNNVIDFVDQTIEVSGAFC